MAWVWRPSRSILAIFGGLLAAGRRPPWPGGFRLGWRAAGAAFAGRRHVQSKAAQRGEFSRSLADASRKILPPPKPRSRQPNFTGPNSSSSVARDGSHSPSHLSLTRYPKGQAGVSRISPNRAFAQISLPNCYFVKGNLRRRGRAARWVLIFQFQDILWRTASCLHASSTARAAYTSASNQRRNCSESIDTK